MNNLFKIVYQALVAFSRVTGFTYNEVNIIVYYFIIPLIYFTMIDKILKTHALKIAFTLVSVVIAVFTNFTEFSDRLFDISVQFLLLFSVIGWNYIVASVIICVFVPILIFIPLFFLSYYPDIARLFNRDKERGAV